MYSIACLVLPRTNLPRCLARTLPLQDASMQSKKCSRGGGLDTPLVLSLHPFSFAAQAPAGHGTRGEATGRHAPSLNTTPAVHEPLRPLIFHRCFSSHLQPHRLLYPYASATFGGCYPRSILGNNVHGPAAMCVPPTCSLRQAGLHVRMSACGKYTDKSMSSHTPINTMPSCETHSIFI